MTNRAVTIRPFASRLIDPDCTIPACEGPARWAVSRPGPRFVETEHACDAHVGDVAGNRAKRVNREGVSA